MHPKMARLLGFRQPDFEGFFRTPARPRPDRAELAKVIGRLEPDDVLIVTRLDRLARSTRDLLNVIDAVTKLGAGFRSLKDTWADTTSPPLRSDPGMTIEKVTLAR
jgi:DNA invertase Pin-like site-specific DNA recombinase